MSKNFLGKKIGPSLFQKRGIDPPDQMSNLMNTVDLFKKLNREAPIVLKPEQYDNL